MWTVSPKELIAATQILNLVPIKTGLPSSSFVRLHERKHRLWMSLSTEIAGSVHIKGKGVLGLKKPVYLDRALLFPFILGGLKYKTKKPFDITVEKEKLLITQGRRKGSFQYATEGSGYLDATTATKGTELVLSKHLIELLKVAAECATPDQTAPELACVMVKRGESSHDVKILSSNQLIVFSASRKEKAKFPRKLPFPLQLIPFLELEDMQSIRYHEAYDPNSGSGVMLNFDCGCIWQPLSEKAEKGFPSDTLEGLMQGKTYKYSDKKGKKHKSYSPPAKGKHISSTDWPERFQIKAGQLGEAVGRFSDYLSSAKKEQWTLRVYAEKGSQHVIFESLAQQAEFREKIAVERAIGESFSVNWPLDILLPVFRHLEKGKSTISARFGDKTPCLLTAGGVSMVVARQEK